jgi:amidase
MSHFELDTPTAVGRIRESAEASGAYVTTCCDEALELADALATQEPRSALHGVPYGLKDEWDTVGIRTTAGSWRHRERIPETDHPVYEVFRDAGAVLVGKTNLSDMGLAPESTNYIAGPARNPFDRTRTAGGSSGGAALAVAEGMQGFDWGTDIGGSIRLPATYCGVLGMRLSDETWPIPYLFPGIPAELQWMCGQGPLTVTVAQMRDVLGVAAAKLRAKEPTPFEVKRVALYLPQNKGRWPTFVDDVSSPLGTAAGAAVDLISDELPRTGRVQAIYNATWASHHATLLDVDPTIGFGEGIRAVLRSVFFHGFFGDKRFHPTTAEILLLIHIGGHTIYRNRAKAIARAYEVRDAIRALWDKGTLLVMPVCAYPPPKLGRTKPHHIESTVPGNIGDATGLAIPWGAFDGGLPRSLQLLGPPGSEDTLLDIAERLIPLAPARIGRAEGG